MDTSIIKHYGNKVRSRVSGLCWQNDRLLLVNHAGLTSGDFWAPPGGGLEFGENAEKNLVREVYEETGIDIVVKKFLFVCEFISPPLHSIELFFHVAYRSGIAKTGFDPEMSQNEQIIKAVKWMTPEEIKALPKDSLHGIFQQCTKPEDLLQLQGYWQI